MHDFDGAKEDMGNLVYIFSTNMVRKALQIDTRKIGATINCYSIGLYLSPIILLIILLISVYD